MAHDLPTRQHSKCTFVDVPSSSLSEAPSLSPTQRVLIFGHEERSKSDIRKGTSFLARKFGSARQQTSDKEINRGPLGLRPLFCAPEPLIDLVFVHGLRGGSIKTWRFEEDQQLFWPRYWLPKEPEFANVSIHSFGYESDWGSMKRSVLDVNDFGRSLFEELLTHPLLRHGSNNGPIILIGHSMGGLVIKKTYILAKEDQAHPELAGRLRCMFFLATPHRGSDYAAVLNNVLKYCGITGLTSQRDYIKDLKSGSVSTQLINDNFARYAKDLTIYSFCETLPTISGSSALIVDKSSAILGLHPQNEHIQYLHANHREICKFRSRTDSNYIILKNALGTAVENLLKSVVTTNNLTSKDEMRNVHDLLRATYVFEEHHDKLDGSCQWIEKREDFRTWIGEVDRNELTGMHRPSFFWVQAHPGAGKTVLSAHVAAQLSDFRLPHASYFFHFGKKSTQSLAGMLQSVALQMAYNNTAIRKKLADVYELGASFDRDDARAVWQKVFVGGIFQVSSLEPQYWVIDALDECALYSDFFKLVKGLQSRFPLRIFMTSRKLTDMSRLTRSMEGCDVVLIEIPATDTMKDINLYIYSRVADLSVDAVDEREELARLILAKSDTSFLWVRLVMDELEGLYSYDSIMQVLQGIPEGMLPYYERVVAEMSERKREQHVAKAILLWVMLATRPLSVSELSHALQLDIKVHLPSAKAAIEGLCGQLVSVDMHTGLVQPVHATAREFILSEEAGEFRVLKTQGHEKIALTCLGLLAGTDMQPPRHRRLLHQKRGKPSSSALMDYAITQFSEHVLGASTESGQLVSALDKFLRTTVLTWIEKVMLNREFHRLIRTAKNLKAYLDRRAKCHLPLNNHVNTIEAWATDLTRIVSSFGRALVRSPQSVYFLIPPLCPTQTAIFRQFAKTPDGLAISGYRRSEWSDCIANVRFEDETAAAIGCGNSLIAIGLECGTLELYNSRSLQKESSIDIQSAVDKVYFDPSGSFVAVASRKTVSLWNTDGSLRWKTRVRSCCILFESFQDVLMSITQQGRSYQWDIQSGDLVQDQVYHYLSPDPEIDAQMRTHKAPSTASVSPGLELIAFAYRNSPVCIFESGTGSLISWVVDDNNRAAEQVIFNPNPDLSLLLVAYNESHLALYDSWSGSLVASAEAESHVILNSVTCSPDGRTFAAVDVRGHLRIWDFESLTLLYHVLTPHHSFSLLQFTSDGLGLVHVVEHEMRVWAPSALVRETVEEETNLSDQSPVLPVTEGQFEKFQASKIKTVIAHPNWPVLFAGNHNGDVVQFHATDSYYPSTLYSHNGVAVKCLASNNSNIVASADVHGHVQVRQFEPPKSGTAQSANLSFQKNFNTPIVQLLFDASSLYLLISTVGSVHVYNTSNGICVGAQWFPALERPVSKWFIAPELGYQTHFLLLEGDKVTTYSTGNFSEPGSVIAEIVENVELKSIESITHLSGTTSVIVETQNDQLRTSTSIFSLPFQGSATPQTARKAEYTLSADVCARFIGISRVNGKMMILQPDSWVCSMDLKDLGANQCLEHFFIPEEYGALNSDVRPVKTVDGDFAFCLYDKVVVVRSGLKFGTKRVLAPSMYHRH